MSRSPLAGRLVLAGLLSGLLWGLSTVKATTRQGVDFTVSTLKIPLYVKGLAFLHRHEQYRVLAQQITRGLESDHERVLAIFEWTRQHIRLTPSDVPVMDDHVLHIIIRGHGLDDQIADVFTTLSTYAGTPAFWQTLKVPQARAGVVVSFVKVEGRWRVFDVSRGFIFRDRSGALATPQDIAGHPELIAAVAGDARLGEMPYTECFGSLASFNAPRPLRAELQQPWPRLWDEARRVLGRLGHRL